MKTTALMSSTIVNVIRSRGFGRIDLLRAFRLIDIEQSWVTRYFAKDVLNQRFAARTRTGVHHWPYGLRPETAKLRTGVAVAFPSEIIRRAEKWANARRAEGWTQNRFATELQQFLDGPEK
jgi:hypothetical protein